MKKRTNCATCGRKVKWDGRTDFEGGGIGGYLNRRWLWNVCKQGIGYPRRGRGAGGTVSRLYVLEIKYTNTLLETV